MNIPNFSPCSPPYSPHISLYSPHRLTVIAMCAVECSRCCVDFAERVALQLHAPELLRVAVPRLPCRAGARLPRSRGPSNHHLVPGSGHISCWSSSHITCWSSGHIAVLPTPPLPPRPRNIARSPVVPGESPARGRSAIISECCGAGRRGA